MDLELFKKLARKYPTPFAVQKLLRQIPYNKSDIDTMFSAREAWVRNKAHCLEATFLAAAILEQAGFPPLVVSMESIDQLDHVIFVFKEKGGWGSVGRSRIEGLHGRAPVFKNLKSLVESYLDPYVDETGRITGYGLGDLRDCNAPWRTSSKNVWAAEKFLIDLNHSKIHMSERQFKKAQEIFAGPGHKPKAYWL